MILDAFAACGFHSPGPYFAVYYVSETSPHWEKLNALVRNYNPTEFVFTKYTEKERRSAKYLCMNALLHTGYPQPEDDYLELTYDVTESCSWCKMGRRQKAPFRFKGEPPWGKRSIIGLYWEYGEFFVKPDFWEQYLEPLGIAVRPVIRNRTGKSLETVVQLDVPERTPLQMNREPESTCGVCNRERYHYKSLGYMPKPADIDAHIFKSEQYFGSGGSSNQQVMVSQEFYRVFKLSGAKGVSFEPCVQ